jgi:hypothetical protein
VPAGRLVGVLPVGFLRRDEVAARGLVFFFRRTSVRLDIAEALGDRALLDLGGALMRDAGLVVAVRPALMCRLVALVRTLGVLGGARHVVRGDGLARGQYFSPAQQFLGAPGGLVCRCLAHETTVDPMLRRGGVVLFPRLRVG